jgi:uncharacterized protein (TIGR03437 family)
MYYPDATSHQRFRNRSVTVQTSLLLLTLLLLTGSWLIRPSALLPSGIAAVPFAVNPVSVTTVSAFTFEQTAIAPQSIVAGFGTMLATGTEAAPSLPLPTTLAGTAVLVNGVAAPLLLVSPNQINYLIPAETVPGTAGVVVTSGDGTVSNGTIQVRAVAPVILTANSGGSGVPNGQVIRVAANGTQTFDSLAQLNPATGSFVPKPLAPLAPGESLFAVLFLSGTRQISDTDGNAGNGSAENARVVIGGQEIAPVFLGAAPGQAGLEQMNIEIPRSLFGHGLVNLLVTGGGTGSNLTEVEFAAPAGNAPPVITSVNPSTSVLAGQPMTLNGQFVVSPQENTVRITGIQARILSAALTQLTVLAPFGLQSGQVRVATLSGEGVSPSPITVRTSESGFLESTINHQPLQGFTARQLNTAKSGQSAADGSFVVADVSNGGVIIQVDASTYPLTPPYPSLLLKTNVTAGRDNAYGRPITLQPITGQSLTVGSSGEGKARIFSNAARLHAAAVPAAKRAQDQGILFEVADNVQALFPNGARAGALTVTKVVESRTPVNLPPGVFSAEIVQITPFRVSLSPGGKLIFPNTDKLPAGSKARLYKLDQTPYIPGATDAPGNPVINPTLGTFIIAGEATVSSDGLTVETAPDAITESSMYFVAASRASTTIVGRAIDCECDPATRILVRARGEQVYTDGNGGFVLRAVPVLNPGEQIQVEASFLRDDQLLNSVTTSVIPQLSSVSFGTSGVTLVKPNIVFKREQCPVNYDQVVQGCPVGNQFTFRLMVSARYQPSGPFMLPDSGDSQLQYILVRAPINGMLRFGKGRSYDPEVGPLATYFPRPKFSIGSGSPVIEDSFIYKVSNGCYETDPVMVRIRLQCPVPKPSPTPCSGYGCY